MSKGSERHRRWAYVLTLAVLLGTLPQIAISRNVEAATDRTFVAGVAMGGSWPGETNEQIRADLDGVADSGATYIRLTFSWSNIERTKGAYRWNRLDFIVDEIGKRGIDVIAVLAYTPSWARLGECSTSQFCRPVDVADYARFAEAAAAHFTPRGVRIYELWNEPNIVSFFEPKPDPTFYAQMLRTAGPAIRRASPRANVLHAGLSPAPDASNGNRIHPVTFLRAIYDAGGTKQHFDAVAMHPYSYPASPQKYASWNAFSGVMPELYKVMQANGDGDKKIWATEFGAPTAGQNSVDDETQARYVREALEMQQEWNWLGPIVFYNYRNLGTDPHDREDHFGMVTFDGQRKPSYWALQRTLASGQSGGVATTTTTTRATTTTTRPPTFTTTSSPPPTTRVDAPRRATGGVAFAQGWERSSAARISSDLDEVVRLGATSIRLYVPWSDIESTRGTFDLASVTRAAAAATARNLDVVAVLATTPRWARVAACVDDDRCRPANPADFQEFTKTVVEALAPLGVHGWEVWDRPNISDGFAPAPDAGQYSELLRAARAAIRFRDPDRGIVIAGGLAPAPDADNGLRIHPLTFVQGIYANDAGWAPDHFGLQPYTHPVSPAVDQPWNAFSNVAPAIRDFLVSKGAGSTEIWVTGFGAPTQGTNSVNEAGQTRFFEEAFEFQLAWPWLGPIMVDSLRDRGTNPNDAGDHFGLITADGRKKPAYNTVEAILHGRKPPPPPKTPPTTSTTRPTAPTRTTTSTIPQTASSDGGATAGPPDLGPAVFCTRLFCIQISSGT